MADEYDFQINTLKFRAAISDKNPYQRATAPFRKEQFDSSPTVGDQSLTGWWTRGQLSFHKGAGLKYYEVLEGEAVLNRFHSSEGVEVFTPGEVTLNSKVEEVISPALAAGEYIWSAFSDRPSGAWLRTQNNKLWYTGTYPPAAASQKTPATPETDYRTLAAGTTHVYASTGPGYTIERYRLSALSYDGTIYDHTDVIDGIWFAKDRLWVMDWNAKLYAVSPNPAGALPVGLGTPVLTLNATTNDFGERNSICITEIGAGVLLSRFSESIYFIGLNTDGSVPTIAAPVVAATLPKGEYVASMRHYLGYLVICTNRGVRIALVGDGGQVTYGPLCISEMSNANDCRQVSADEAQVAVVGDYLNNGSIRWAAYEIDLSSPHADNPLMFPWRRIWTWPGSDHPQHTGATELNGRHGWWMGTQLYVADRPVAVATGWIRTSFHRLGTLDGKRFDRVTVRADGSGFVDVYQIDANEAETLLGTLVTSNKVGTFSFTLTGATERVALKFVIRAGATDQPAGQAPKLLGYQIKAMPVPERQRLLRWPLIITDTYRTRYGQQRGKVGQAYTGLKALEALESSAAVVTFTDHRTGETGSAYLESVEFQSDTPSSHNTSGFGGIAQVTLRVLS